MDELWPGMNDDIDKFLKSVEENPLPTYEKAKEIVENAEIINKGTPYEFVKGCMSLRYKNALLVLGMKERKDLCMKS